MATGCFSIVAYRLHLDTPRFKEGSAAFTYQDIAHTVLYLHHIRLFYLSSTIYDSVEIALLFRGLLCQRSQPFF